VDGVKFATQQCQVRLRFPVLVVTGMPSVVSQRSRRLCRVWLRHWFSTFGLEVENGHGAASAPIWNLDVDVCRSS